jgi:hypothetical protein
MSLYKAIESGKEKRKQYRKSKAFDRSCRNHGGCGYCEENRTYRSKRLIEACDDDLNSMSDDEFSEYERVYFDNQLLEEFGFDGSEDLADLSFDELICLMS